MKSQNFLNPDDIVFEIDSEVEHSNLGGGFGEGTCGGFSAGSGDGAGLGNGIYSGDHVGSVSDSFIGASVGIHDPCQVSRDTTGTGYYVHNMYGPPPVIRGHYFQDNSPMHHSSSPMQYGDSTQYGSPTHIVLQHAPVITNFESVYSPGALKLTQRPTVISSHHHIPPLGRGSFPQGHGPPQELLSINYVNRNTPLYGYTPTSYGCSPQKGSPQLIKGFPPQREKNNAQHFSEPKPNAFDFKEMKSSKEKVSYLRYWLNKGVSASEISAYLFLDISQIDLILKNDIGDAEESNFEHGHNDYNGAQDTDINVSNRFQIEDVHLLKEICVYLEPTMRPSSDYLLSQTTKILKSLQEKIEEVIDKNLEPPTEISSWLVRLQAMNTRFSTEEGDINESDTKPSREANLNQDLDDTPVKSNALNPDKIIIDIPDDEGCVKCESHYESIDLKSKGKQYDHRQDMSLQPGYASMTAPLSENITNYPQGEVTSEKFLLERKEISLDESPVANPTPHTSQNTDDMAYSEIYRCKLKCNALTKEYTKKSNLSLALFPQTKERYSDYWTYLRCNKIYLEGKKQRSLEEQSALKSIYDLLEAKKKKKKKRSKVVNKTVIQGRKNNQKIIQYSAPTIQRKRKNSTHLRKNEKKRKIQQRCEHEDRRIIMISKDEHCYLCNDCGERL